MARITVVSPAEKALAAKGGWISKKKVPGGKAAGSREGKKGPGGVQGKPREQAIAGAGSGGRKSGAGKSTQKEAASISHPYDHDPADDCETSFQAYSDVAAVLKKLAQRLGKSKEALCIWDPYYCNGKTKVHLRKLGFQNVVNENEDCYAMMEGSKPLPGFDVLVTSPPYSRDHIERLLKFTRACGKPFLLLLPDYVHRKSYYPGLLGLLAPFYLRPAKPYVYYAHNGGRRDNTKVPCRHWQRDGSCPVGDECAFLHDGAPKDAAPAAIANPQPEGVIPFSSLWHVYMGERLREKTITWWLQKYQKSAKATLIRQAKDIPERR